MACTSPETQPHWLHKQVQPTNRQPERLGIVDQMGSTLSLRQSTTVLDAGKPGNSTTDCANPAADCVKSDGPCIANTPWGGPDWVALGHPCAIRLNCTSQAGATQQTGHAWNAASPDIQHVAHELPTRAPAVAQSDWSSNRQSLASPGNSADWTCWTAVRIGGPTCHCQAPGRAPTL